MPTHNEDKVWKTEQPSSTVCTTICHHFQALALPFSSFTDLSTLSKTLILPLWSLHWINYHWLLCSAVSLFPPQIFLPLFFLFPSSTFFLPHWFQPQGFTTTRFTSLSSHICKKVSLVRISHRFWWPLVTGQSNNFSCHYNWALCPDSACVMLSLSHFQTTVGVKSPQELRRTNSLVYRTRKLLSRLKSGKPRQVCGRVTWH